MCGGQITLCVSMSSDLICGALVVQGLGFTVHGLGIWIYFALLKV
jgi:hypothetical protein